MNSKLLVAFSVGLLLVGPSAYSKQCAGIFADSKIVKTYKIHLHAEVRPDNAVLWQNSMRHSNDFFIKYGWDEASGSFASELGPRGERLSEARHLIASSRMIYGLAHAAFVDPRYLTYAKTQARFLLTKMTAMDKHGIYFKSHVDANGQLLGPEPELIVNEQAYAMNGLVALYKVTKDPELLEKITEIEAAFYKRFHDPSGAGGFFDSYFVESGHVRKTKSYNSTVYVATSFLLELAAEKSTNQRRYIDTINELANIVTSKFVDTEFGWIKERFDESWNTKWKDTWQDQPPYTVGVTGHNFQAAWFLMKVAELPTTSQQAKERYLAAARTILTAMLKSNTIDRVNGGVGDVFERETDKNKWHDRKAWWQQAEAILALTKADSIGLFNDPRLKADAVAVRDQILEFYFDHFVDEVNGGEYQVVERDGKPFLDGDDGKKGTAGTGSYHQVELGLEMIKNILRRR